MARKPVTDLSAWPSLTLEGNLIAPAMVAKIAAPKDDEETRKSYGIRKGLTVRDEISTAFRVGQSHFDAFRKLENPSADATRRFMRDFLAETLGFDDLAPNEGAVSLLAGGRVPVVVTPPDEEKLDRKSPTLSTDRSRSAAFALQDYVNERDDTLWGLATNGTVLRLMRDNASLTRPAFIEADLAQIFTNEDAASFSILWLLFHRTRFGLVDTPATDCDLERWRDAGAKEGEASRDRLAGQVKLALKLLGSGFLEANPELSKRLQSGDIPLTGWFNELLRLIYRLIFLMVAEDRNLLHPSKATTAARKLYAEGYSLSALRALCTRGSTWDRHHDRYEGIKIIFRALANGEETLALPALGGLFATGELPNLETARLRNRAFMEALYRLSWLADKSGMVPVNWRSMETEELGSVYESLLELQPQLDSDGRSLIFASDAAEQKGNQRKTTGSYYTPDSLVQALLDTALDPVLDQTEAQSDDPAKALLKLSVIDPACGSGHFLLAAARRIATRLARIRADGTPSTEDFRHALRDVARCCIHGVDRNPMAVELTKVALWIETVDPGLPLGFLNHHIVCGDALLGLTDLRQLENGIPDAAFTSLSGDDKKLCTELKKHNKAARKQLDDIRRGQDLLAPPGQPDALGEFSALEALSESTPEEIAAKEAAWLAFLTRSRTSPLMCAANVFVGAFLSPKPTDSTPPDTLTLAAALFPAKATPELTTQIEQARHLCGRDQANVLHWPLTFPKVFARGGFDCILGNPPWERIKLQEEEFFATREPLIATAKNKAERAKRIQWLSEGNLRYHLSQFQTSATPNPAEIQIFRDFEMEKRLAEASSISAHVDGKEGGRYPLTGVGDVNTYALFAETILQLTSPKGRAGFIVPTGIVSDDTTKQFFSAVAETGRLTHLFSFENEEFVFPAVHHSFRFCLMVIAGAPDRDRASIFVFLARQADQLQDDRRRFTLSPEDFRLINPNTRTCPIFRARADAELTRVIYRRVPILIEEARDDYPEINPWGIRFSTMFHMSNDSHLFEDNPGPNLLPLYEAKMVHQFDHRWASYTRTAEGELDTADVTDAEKADSSFTVTPRYWVPRCAVEDALLSKQDPLYPLHFAAREKRRDSLAWWFRCWLWGHELLAGRKDASARLRQEMDDARIVSHDTMEIVMAHEPERQWAERTATTHPLSTDEQNRLWNQIDEDRGLISRDPNIIGGKNSDQLSEEWERVAHAILAKRRRQWVMGWRRNARNHDLRSMILSAMPSYGMGDSVFLMSTEQPSHMAMLLLANANSLVLDFALRQKLAGINLSFFYIKQLPILPPESYNEADLAYIVPRVLELTYTAHDLRPWAEDVITSYQRQFPQHPPLVPNPAHPQPYLFDPDRRAQLRADLDARYARLYSLTRDELRYILDPADTHGRDYPSETFRVLKEKEIRLHGEYRSRRLVLEAWDRMMADGTFAALDLTPGSSQQDQPVQISLPPAKELKDRSWAWPPQVARKDRLRYAAQYALWISNPKQDASRLRILIASLAEPALLSGWLTKDERSQWERLIGPEARPMASGVVRLHPETNAAWKAAFEQLITSGQLREEQDGAWTRGSHFDASGLSADSPDAQRAAFALNAIRRMDIEQLRPLIVLEDNIIWEKLAYGT